MHCKLTLCEFYNYKWKLYITKLLVSSFYSYYELMGLGIAISFTITIIIFIVFALTYRFYRWLVFGAFTYRRLAFGTFTCDRLTFIAVA